MKPKNRLSDRILTDLREIGEEDSIVMRKVMLWGQRYSEAKDAGLPFTEPFPYEEMFRANWAAASEADRERTQALIKGIRERRLAELIAEVAKQFPACKLEIRTATDTEDPDVVCATTETHRCFLAPDEDPEPDDSGGGERKAA